MTLQDLLRQLTFGELKSFSFAQNGKIDDASMPTILEAITLSLNDLYSRFLLNEKELHILCFASKTQYPLRKQHAISDETTGVPKYILDTPDYPFDNDLIQILSVTDEVGYRVTMNDTGTHGSVFIPRYDTVQVTNPTNDKMLAITYQAKHPALLLFETWCSQVFLNQEIILPPILEEALRVRVASRVYSPMDRENQAAKVAMLDNKYEMICSEAEQKNLINGSAFNTIGKLEARGFV